MNLRATSSEKRPAREFRSAESIEEGLRDDRLEQISFALG